MVSLATVNQTGGAVDALRSGKYSLYWDDCILPKHVAEKKQLI